MIPDQVVPPNAACLGSDIDFFPEKGQDEEPAKLVCAACPALVECLEGGLDRREDYGIWGGAGEDWRRALRRVYSPKDGQQDPAAWAEAVAWHISRLDALAVRARKRAEAAATKRVTYVVNGVIQKRGAA